MCPNSIVVAYLFSHSANIQSIVQSINQSIQPPYPIGRNHFPLGARTSQRGLSVLVQNDVGIDTFDRLRALREVGSSLVLRYGLS